MPRKMTWRRLTKPKVVRLRMPGVGLPNDVLRVSLETRDRELGEARIAMLRDLYRRLQFGLLLARHEDRFTTDQLHRAYREGEAALVALLANHTGRLLAPLVDTWAREYHARSAGRSVALVRQFLAAHGGDQATTACLTTPAIAAYLGGLTSQQGRKNRRAGTKRIRPATPPKPARGATRNRHRTALGILCAWLVRRDALAVHPIAGRRVPKFAEDDARMPAPFTPEDTRRYLAALPAEHAHAAALRPVFVLLLYTGADVGEVLTRRAHHVALDRAPARVTYKRTKTKTPTRTVPVDATVAAELRGHVAATDARGEQPLFPGVTLRAVWAAHRVMRAAIGRPSLTVKDLRHVAAIAWTAAGVRIDRVKEMLGHATLSQTYRYIHHSPDTVEEAAIADLVGRQLGGSPDVTPIAAVRAARMP
jgi:integrase